jgi:hypothetical protein
MQPGYQLCSGHSSARDTAPLTSRCVHDEMYTVDGHTCQTLIEYLKSCNVDREKNPRKELYIIVDSKRT